MAAVLGQLPLCLMHDYAKEEDAIERDNVSSQDATNAEERGDV